MRLSVRINGIITYQRSIWWKQDELKVFERDLESQIHSREKPTRIGDVYNAKYSLIDRSDNLLEYLGVSDKNRLKISSERFKKLYEELKSRASSYSSGAYEGTVYVGKEGRKNKFERYSDVVLATYSPFVEKAKQRSEEEAKKLSKMLKN